MKRDSVGCVWVSHWTDEIDLHYWLDRALEEKNINLCNNVVTVKFGDMYVRNGGEVCRYDYLLSTKGVDFCKNKKRAGLLKGSYFNYCIERVGIKSKNPNVCLTLDSKSKINRCFSDIALSLRSQTICNSFADKGIREKCRKNVKELKEDEYRCALTPFPFNILARLLWALKIKDNNKSYYNRVLWILKKSPPKPLFPLPAL